MFKNILKYLTLFHDHGIIDGQVVLKKKFGYDYKTRDITKGTTPKVIIYADLVFVDTGEYDDNRFRIYQEDYKVYKHTAFGE